MPIVSGHKMTVCPFANQSKRYDRKYPGGYVSGFGGRGILHTTETTGLPSYQSGAVAPHFTYDPRTGRIWQHYDTSRPARALQHLPGTIDTNNARAIQIEIIAYSDNAIAKKVKGLRVDQLTAAQLAPLAKLMRWIEANAGVQPKSGLTFESYPGSAGVSNGIRLSDSRWRSFTGWAGHSHVPHNNHGDPSDIAIRSLLAQVVPPQPATEEDVTELVRFKAPHPKAGALYITTLVERRGVVAENYRDQMREAPFNLAYPPVHEFTTDSGMNAYAGHLKPNPDGTVTDYNPDTKEWETH